MTRNRKVVGATVAGAALVVGLGAAGAVAANKILSPRQESQAVIADAASQLGVQPSALSKALKQALKNRIDAAVAAGLLTKDQGVEMKARIDSNDFPLFGHGRFGGPGFDGDHGFARMHLAVAAAASYLGVSETDLRQQLRTSTLADLARKKGKSVDGLVTAMVNTTEQEIDKAAQDGTLTKDQAAALKADLKQHVQRLVNGEWRQDGPESHPPFGYRFHGPRGPPAGFGAYSPPV